MFASRISLYNLVCLVGFEQQKESASRGNNAALPGEHCLLHGGSPHGVSQQPVDNHLQPVPDIPSKTTLSASSQGRYRLLRSFGHGLIWFKRDYGSRGKASSGALVAFNWREAQNRN